MVKLMSEFKEVLLLVMSALLAWRCGARHLEKGHRFSEQYGIAIIGDVPKGFPELAWPLQTSFLALLACGVASGGELCLLLVMS